MRFLEFGFDLRAMVVVHLFGLMVAQGLMVWTALSCTWVRTHPHRFCFFVLESAHSAVPMGVSEPGSNLRVIVEVHLIELVVARRLMEWTPLRCTLLFHSHPHWPSSRIGILGVHTFCISQGVV